MLQSLAYFTTLLRRDFTEYCNEKLQEMGLSQGLIFFVLYVGKHPQCSPKELAEALQMDPGHTARTIAKLEQGGFLIQEKNPSDRRAHLLRLTTAGNDAVKASHDLFTQWDNKTMSPLSAQEQEQLLYLLNKLTPDEMRGAPCTKRY